MMGWKQRFFPVVKPPLLPRCLVSSWWIGSLDGRSTGHTKLCVFLCFIVTYGASLAIRLLEVPFWYNPEYIFNGEFLLATHDAYHWVAGAEGFEFGASHPMSKLLRVLSSLLHMKPVILSFWFPPFAGALLAVAVCLWGWGLGRPYAGLCAGVVASLSPAFFGRTQLGFYDTDLVVLLFSVLVGLVPALWLHPWLKSFLDAFAEILVRGKNQRDLGQGKKWSILPARIRCALESKIDFLAIYFSKQRFVPLLDRSVMEKAMLSPGWLLALCLAGLFGFWVQEWHSFFPYYIRFSALLLPTLIVVAGPIQGRSILLQGGLCYCFPLLLGVPGLFFALAYALFLHVPFTSPTDDSKSFLVKIQQLLCSIRCDNRVLGLLWLIVFFLCLDITILGLMHDSFMAYVSRSGDVAFITKGGDPLVFPSVSQSILETQTLSLDTLLYYYYPNEILVALSLLAVVVRLIKTPVITWFLPFLGLFFMSRYMGGRMAMFGPPVFALCLCLEGGALAGYLFSVLKKLILDAFSVLINKGAGGKDRFEWGKFAFSFICMGYLVWPLVVHIPSQSANGPIISKEQAAALSFIGRSSPVDTLVWNWWDWGYATHYFAKRHTIADGARHGGASLYLPAAVYTTGDPRFARQVIKYTASKGNVPGNVFSGLTASQAQKLMIDLGDKGAPLIKATGTQYLVISYDIVIIGAWISNFGSWNFDKKKMSSALLSDISQGEIQFNSETGTLLYAKKDPDYKKEMRTTLQAASISIISPEKLLHYTYKQDEGGRQRLGNHFIFDTKQRDVDVPEKLKSNWAYRFWNRELGGFHLYSAATNKLLMDPVFYNTMMVQLLISPKDDPRFTPYFRCVFDNVYTRVYQVL